MFLRALALLVVSTGFVLAGIAIGGVFLPWAFAVGFSLCVTALVTGWLNPRPSKPTQTLAGVHVAADFNETAVTVRGPQSTPGERGIKFAPTTAPAVLTAAPSTVSALHDFPSTEDHAEASGVFSEQPIPRKTGVTIVLPSASPGPHVHLRGRESLHPATLAAVSHRAEGDIDFARNAGQPGFLYAARNPRHVPGLFKLGQTVEGPRARLLRLNDEHRLSPGLGEFELLHAVPVADAYGFEQQLFNLLSAYRVTEKKEFFLMPPGSLLALMDRLPQPTSVNGAFPVGWLPTLPPPDTLVLDVIRQKVTFQVQVPPLGDSAGGWLLMLRNECDGRDLFRLVRLQSDPYEYMATVNATQARATARVGHVALVGCWACANPRAALEQTLRTLGPTSRVGRTTFVQGDFSAITAAACVAAEHTTSSGRLREQSDARVSTAPSTNAPGRHSPESSATRGIRKHHPKANGTHRQPPDGSASRLANTCPHPQCTAQINMNVGDGQSGEIRCSRCRRPVGYLSEEGCLVVWCANE